LSPISQKSIRGERLVDLQLSATPTDAEPGSPAKIIVLMRRYAMGQPLCHPLDATDETQSGRRKQMLGNTVQVY
jgi:hypothetical protein